MVAVLCLVFALFFAAPNAYADSFTPIFTCTGTCVAQLLPTAPDVTFPFTIAVTWDSNLIFPLDLFSISSNPNDGFLWEGDVKPGVLTFKITNQTSAAAISQSLSCPSCTTTFTDMGVLTFSPVATPEPSSLALMLSGVGLVFAMRKRLAGLQLAS
jgi:hypothetical protein